MRRITPVVASLLLFTAAASAQTEDPPAATPAPAPAPTQKSPPNHDPACDNPDTIFQRGPSVTELLRQQLVAHYKAYQQAGLTELMNKINGTLQQGVKSLKEACSKGKTFATMAPLSKPKEYKGQCGAERQAKEMYELRVMGLRNVYDKETKDAATYKLGLTKIQAWHKTLLNGLIANPEKARLTSVYVTEFMGKEAAAVYPKMNDQDGKYPDRDADNKLALGIVYVRMHDSLEYQKERLDGMQKAATEANEKYAKCAPIFDDPGANEPQQPAPAPTPKP